MAGSRIKGITVEIGGDTTKLQSALKGVNSEIKNTQSQLKDVEKLLKLDPGNTELLAQKQKLLSSAVSETKEKLATLKTAAEHEDFEAAAALIEQRASEKGIKKGNAKYQQRYAFILLDQFLTAKGIQKIPIKIGTVTNRYGDHTYFPKIQNVFVLKMSAPLPTKGNKSNTFCNSYGRYSAIIIGPYTQARLNKSTSTLFFTVADINITTPANPSVPSNINIYS